MLGEPLENATIVLEQGRIVRVEQNASLSAVDLGDRCIVPRFVNSHTHLEFSGLESPLPCSDSFAAWIGSVVQWRRQQQQMLGDQWVTYQRRAVQQGIEECPSMWDRLNRRYDDPTDATGMACRLSRFTSHRHLGSHRMDRSYSGSSRSQPYLEYKV